MDIVSAECAVPDYHRAASAAYRLDGTRIGRISPNRRGYDGKTKATNKIGPLGAKTIKPDFSVSFSLKFLLARPLEFFTSN